MKIKEYYELIKLGKEINNRFETIMRTASEFKNNNDYKVTGFDIDNVANFTSKALMVISNLEV